MSKLHGLANSTTLVQTQCLEALQAQSSINNESLTQCVSQMDEHLSHCYKQFEGGTTKLIDTIANK